ncbi:MAG: hypothetical protein ACREIC_32820, partial [Limisphaerales bacterium]
MPIRKEKSGLALGWYQPAPEGSGGANLVTSSDGGCAFRLQFLARRFAADFQSTGPHALQSPRVAVATQPGHGRGGLRQPSKRGVADATHGAYRRWVHGL